MNLVNEKVIHETFGEGNVTNCNDSYIKINFESGDKKFVFPDVFENHVTFISEEATNLVNKKLEENAEQRKKEELILEKEKALEQELRYIENQKKLIKNGKVHSKVQSVFWCEEDEVEEVFAEWKVFTGEIKSGDNKGQPRKLARMNKNSACLLTKREEETPEGDRQVLGLFMTNESFDGRLCDDGYITAHPKYRIYLSEEESEKILFWNYYNDKVGCDKTVWNSGRQRYIDNIYIAQILRDIGELKENPEEKRMVQAFFEYFCKINLINQNELARANGALLCAVEEEIKED